jgi:hypothetical protein
VSCTICSSRSRRPVRKLLDTPSYPAHRKSILFPNCTGCHWVLLFMKYPPPHPHLIGSFRVQLLSYTFSNTNSNATTCEDAHLLRKMTSSSDSCVCNSEQRLPDMSPCWCPRIKLTPYYTVTPCRSVSILVARIWLDDRGSILGGGWDFFLIATASRPVLGCAHSPIQWVLEILSRGKVAGAWSWTLTSI